MKKIPILFLMITLVSVFYLVGCTYKKEATAYPIISVTCDTSNVRYSIDVVNILSTNCYTCHATAVANSLGGGNRLDSYTNLKPYANSGLLLNVITHVPGSDFMPKNGSKISDCDIAKIRTWIRNGMLNN